MEMKDKIKEVLERAEPFPSTVSKTDRIAFYQKQLRDILELVVKNKSSTKKKKKE